MSWTLGDVAQSLGRTRLRNSTRRNLPIPRRRPHGFQQFGSCRVLSPEKPDSSCGIHHSAEAVLKLRAVRANGDFDDYWIFHLNHERQRIHEARYADGILPLAA